MKRTHTATIVEDEARTKVFRDYEGTKYATRRFRAITALEQDIAPVPQVVDWDRRNSCRWDLERYLRTYLKPQFYLPLSEDHRKVIVKAEAAVLNEGLYACAMPRGSGKTEMVKGITTWALSYGHRKFVLLIGSTAPAGFELLDGIKYFLDATDDFPLLLEDFPELIYPIYCLEGEARRAHGQRCSPPEGPEEGGAPKTGIVWASKEIVLPRIPDGNWIDGETIGPPPCAGGLIRVTGITGRLRGFNVNGKRPDFVIPDDPQTDESARSVSGNEKIERILGKAVIGLAGPGRRIAGIMPCTVIEEDDAVDRVLNHERHPEWDSTRSQLIYQFPSEIQLWDNYRNIKNEYNPLIDGDKDRAAEEATQYYRDHLEAMQKGAVVAWEHRYNPETEVDALQHAMNLYYHDPIAFQSEFQNAPKRGATSELDELKSNDLISRLSHIERGLVPAQATHLTVGVDVQKDCLYWAMAAWRLDDFTGWLIDYGTWPEQTMTYYKYAEIRRTIEMVTGDKGDSSIVKALRSFSNIYLSKAYPHGLQGLHIRPAICLIDSAYMAAGVKAFCQESTYRNIAQPGIGKGITENVQPIDDWRKQPGEIKRPNTEWVSRLGPLGRYTVFDANHWKTELHRALSIQAGAPSSLTLFGSNPIAHRMIADHLVSEIPVEVTGLRKIIKWIARPNVDNHLLDAVVRAMVGASVLGVGIQNVHVDNTKKKKRVKFSDLKRQMQNR